MAVAGASSAMRDRPLASSAVTMRRMGGSVSLMDCLSGGKSGDLNPRNVRLHRSSGRRTSMLNTRREFLGSAGALAGLVFVGCEMLAVPHAHGQPRRRQ